MTEEEKAKEMIAHYKATGLYPLPVHFIPDTSRHLLECMRARHVKCEIGPMQVEVEETRLNSVFLPVWVHGLYNEGRVERGAKVGLPSNTAPKDVPHSYTLDIPEDPEALKGYNVIEADRHDIDPERLEHIANSEEEQKLLLTELSMKTKDPLYLEGLKSYA